MPANTVQMGEVKTLLNYFFDNNEKLQEKGIVPVSVGLEAQPGIGKTSVIEQVAAERGMNYVCLSLSQLEEAGD